MSKTETNVKSEKSELKSDKAAAAMLVVLMNTYRSLKKDKPKPVSEAKILSAAFKGDGIDVDAEVEQYSADLTVWVEKLTNLLHAIQEIGESNPSASIRLYDKNGDSFTVNGERLASALGRMDGRILSAKTTL